MILVGQYDSPYVRRVAVSLRVLGFEYTHDTRSVFADFDAMRQVNPLGRIPSLTLDDGETLIDSGAILDWLDESVGPERALIPAKGAERRETLRRMALATGAMDKTVTAFYERIVRPTAYRYPEWIERCRTQAVSAIEALAAKPWPGSGRLDQAQITTACHRAATRRSIHYPRTAKPGRSSKRRTPPNTPCRGASLEEGSPGRGPRRPLRVGFRATQPGRTARWPVIPPACCFGPIIQAPISARSIPPAFLPG
jgi:glutathione S-transferase